jgi:hypothetical protein
MGKRSNTMRSNLEVQETDEMYNADQHQKTGKRLRSTPPVSSHNTAAALTLLSLKNEANCFRPSFPLLMTNNNEKSPRARTLFHHDEDDEPTIVSKSYMSCASSVCSASVANSTDKDREQDERCTARISSAPPPHQIHCTISPLHKPMLGHLYGTSAATVAYPVGQKLSVTAGSFCRPMPPPPVLPKFLVRSSYPPYAVPARSSVDFGGKEKTAADL